MKELDGFIDKKKAESPFLSLADGESAVIKELKSIKIVTKAGFDGKEKEVLRLVCDVETPEGMREKSFDNGTQRFAEELQKKGVEIGCSFTIEREGEQTKTVYKISNVTLKDGKPVEEKADDAGDEGETAESPGETPKEH